jgi:type II secretory pathway component GspD/PulD (secretin)
MTLTCVGMGACVSSGARSKANQAALRSDWDAAVAYYREAVLEDPKALELKIQLERAMREASSLHITRARKLEEQDQLAGAAAEYRQAVEYDPSNSLALSRALALERRMRELTEAERPRTRMEEMRQQALQTSPIPRLDPRTPLPAITFNNSSVRDILNTIGDATGISVTYDTGTEGIIARPYSINTADVTLESVLNQIMTMFTLTFKVLDPRKIFVYADNSGNRNKYEDLYQQTFYLSHADVGEVSQILNQMLSTSTTGTRPVVTQHKTLNAINVRASAPMMGLIKNIIDTADKPRAEILVDVTILEVSRTRLKDLGIDLSSYAIGLAFSPETTPTTVDSQRGFITPPPPINASSLSGFARSSLYLTFPTAVIRLLESDQRTRILAKPQLRGREGAALTLNLGDEIPIPRTSFLATATGGIPTQPQISYDYKTVGVNLSITPRVTFQDEIILEPIVVDKSGVGPSVDVGGIQAPTFVKRTAQVAMRLRDGESNLLAGLIKEEDREIAKSLPGINRVPILRSLFGNTIGTNDQTDIIMIVTPHIIRSREITADDLRPLYVGTNINLGAGSTPTLISPAAGPPPPTTVGNPAQQGQVAGQIPTQPTGAAGAAAGGAGGGAAAPPRANVVPVVPIEAAGGPPPPAGARVLVQLPEAPLQVGGPPYTLPLRIEGVSQLGSATVTITYDPKILKASSVSPGPFIQQGGVQPTFLPKIDEVAGRIDIAIARPVSSPGAAGDGWLAGLVFQAVAPGTTRLTVAAVAKTPNGQDIPLQVAPATVVVK